MANPPENIAEKNLFIISGSCPPDQRRVFEAINNALIKFDITADEFDQCFRLQLMQQSVIVASTASTNVMEKLNEVQGGGPDIPRSAEIDKLLGGRQNGIEVKVKSGINGKNIDSILDKTEELKPKITSNVAEKVTALLGRFQDIDPNTLTERERKIYDHFNKDVARIVRSNEEYTSFNLLQTIADGKPLRDDKGEYGRWDNVPGLSLETASYNTYVVRAIDNALAHSIQRKGISDVYVKRNSDVVYGLSDALNAMGGHVTIGGKVIVENRDTNLTVASPVPVRNRPTDRIEARRQRTLERLAASATPPLRPISEDTPKAPVDPNLQVAEAEKRRLEAAIAFTPFIFSGYAQSVLDRGNSNAPRPTKPNERAAKLRLQDVVLREILPIRGVLNKNFEPHNTLGGVLFLNDNHQVMRIVENINTGARPQWANEQGRAQAAEQIQRIFSLEFDESAVHQANTHRHEQLLNALSNAPLLLIAAVGSLEQVRKAQDLQQQLFPERKSKLDEAGRADLIQQRSLLAVEALEQAGIEVPPAIIDKITPPQKTDAEGPLVADNQQAAGADNGSTQAAGSGTGGRPPRRPALPSGFSPDGDDPDDRIPSKLPLTAYDVGQIIDAHVNQREPGHNLWKLDFVSPNGRNGLSLTLYNDHDNHQRPIFINLQQPEEGRALRLFWQAISHITDNHPELKPYYPPSRPGRYSPGFEDPIPMGEFRAQLKKGSGAFKIKLEWPATAEPPREFIDWELNLGLPRSVERREDAEHRVEVMRDIITALRDAHEERFPGEAHMNITKGQLIDLLKDNVARDHGEWLYPREELISPNFPGAIVLNPPEGSDQRAYLRIDPMVQTGSVDNTWSQGQHLFVNGKRIRGGGAQVNTQVIDDETGSDRSHYTVQYKLQNIDGKEFALDPEDPTRLRVVTEAELAANPNLIGQYEMRKINTHLRKYDKDVGAFLRETEKSNGRINFSVEIVKGVEDGLEEPIPASERRGDATRTIRHFSVSDKHPEQPELFVNTLNDKLKITMQAAYSPKVPAGYRADEAPKSRRRYGPAKAINAFDGAIRQARMEHPHVKPNRTVSGPGEHAL